MSAYPPPKENLPIFNPIDFQFVNYLLTINDAKDFFLEYPTAQGEETLSSIIVNGASTFNDQSTHNDLVIINQPTSALNALNIQNDETGYAIRAEQRTGTGGIFQLSSSASAGKDNVICVAGDSVLSGGIDATSGALTLVPRTPLGVGQGIRLVYNANEIYGSTEIKNGGPGASNPGQLVFPDGTIQTTASQVQSTPTLTDVMTSGNSAGSNNLNMNANDVEAVSNIEFQDGTTQNTAYVGQSINQQTTTSNTPTYDTTFNITTYIFPTYPTTYDAFEWVFNTPHSAQSTLTFNNLGSTPPLQVGIVAEPSTSTSGGTFLYMTGTGYRQPYTATSSNMITFCAGFQQNYSISATGQAVIMKSTSVQGGALINNVEFYSNDLTENNGNCPPTGNPIAGYIRIQFIGNFVPLGVASIRFIETI